jgi:hypothetical protein
MRDEGGRGGHSVGHTFLTPFRLAAQLTFVRGYQFMTL